VDLVNINQQVAMDQVLNDVTVAAYDVVLDQGPSYATKREEARESMLTFLQQAPSATPVVLDLLAQSFDWPNADKIADRLKTLLPPAIQAQEAEESGEEPPPPPPPSPEVQLEAAKMQAETQKAQLSVQEKQMDVHIKQIELEGVDPRIVFGEQMQALQATAQQLTQAVTALMQQINSPKQIVRGPDGRALGVESNGQIKQVIRDEQGRVQTLQ
jgi:hypothetical protein